MATFTYNYIPGSAVFHVSADNGVRPGVVKTVTMVSKIAINTITYNVAFTDSRSGAVDAEEVDLFADIDLALAYYKDTYVL